MSSNIPLNEQPNRQGKSLAQSTLERPGALRALFERTVLTWRLFWDSRVGIGPKLIPLAGIVYLVSPVDLFPELFMGPLAPLGYLDDVGIILLALNWFIKVSPPDVVKEHLRELGRGFANHGGDDEDVIEGSATSADDQ
jgi:uncharacterized membrane protein YkvA (DUF1232 family)